MAKRRTKAEMQHAEYCKDVDNYKWFVFNRATNRVESGWEYKEDAIDALDDYDGLNINEFDCDVFSKRAMKTKGINIDQIINKWKM